jgi:hypothetical protein
MTERDQNESQTHRGSEPIVPIFCNHGSSAECARVCENKARNLGRITQRLFERRRRGVAVTGARVDDPKRYCCKNDTTVAKVWRKT